MDPRDERQAANPYASASGGFTFERTSYYARASEREIDLIARLGMIELGGVRDHTLSTHAIGWPQASDPLWDPAIDGRRRRTVFTMRPDRGSYVEIALPPGVRVDRYAGGYAEIVADENEPIPVEIRGVYTQHEPTKRF